MIMAVLRKTAIILSKTASTRFARTVFFRIELTQTLSNHPALRDSLGSSSLTNLRKQAFDVVSK